ncbi:uncharacterized protein LOC122332913 [Puntigrus tetrazona]|uniref:uncharacterized protein LOC122332913 n=1 Tax=Puntigrus tetrazona TaxID=1606681 RepID=UPI001C8AB1C3|nr:uncharacterized protein LOC122332913 [Puntigrus tetrazona]
MILLSLLVLAGVCDAGTDETLSVMEGDSVILQTNLSEIMNDNTILWGFGPKEFIISQITKKNNLPILYVTDDVSFADRLQVDQKTGSLTIRNTRNKHSGQYKLTISREQTTSTIFHVLVLDVANKMGGVKSKSVIEGGSVLLRNDAELQKDDLIVWRFGEEGVLLGKYDAETKQLSLSGADERFKNRLQLDPTGSLTLTSARTEHAGLYEAQIRGRGSSQQFLVSVTADLSRSSSYIVGVVVAVLLAGLLTAVVIYYRRKISKLQKQVVSEMEGRTVVLKTDTELHNGDEIKWWFEDDNKLIAQKSNWTSGGRDIDCDVTDERFRNKLQLGHKNGDLIISYIRTIHAGVYKVQISSKIRRTKYKRFLVTVDVEKVPVKVGKPVLLKTNIDIKEGDLILWTFGVKNRLVVKAESGKNTVSESFAGRLELNELHVNGSLSITNISAEDFGHFQLQVLNNERNRFRRFNVINENSVKKLKEEEALLSRGEQQSSV